MAGGTGGHVIPGLTVANALLAQGAKVSWLGTEQGLEAKLVPAAKIPIHYIVRTPVRGKSIKTLFVTPWRLLCAFIQVFLVMLKINPDVVVGMGGFVSFPGGIVAWLLRKPLIIHEQNAIAGLTNRFLAKIAKKRFQAFPNVFLDGITIGNPLRPEIINTSLPSERFANRVGPLRLLIVGGSQGAIALNQVVVEAMRQLMPNQHPDMWHIAGAGKTKEIKKIYEELNMTVKLDEFVNDVAEAYQWADIVLGRAGALTVSELAAVGVGSILIPFPHAVDNHQTFNAKLLADVNAAMVVPQHEFTSQKLIQFITKLQQNRSELLRMAKQARSVAKLNATEQLVKACL